MKNTFFIITMLMLTNLTTSCTQKNPEILDFTYRLSPPNYQAGMACLKALSQSFIDIQDLIKDLGVDFTKEYEVANCHNRDDLITVHYTYASSGYTGNGILYFFDKATGEMIYREDAHESEEVAKIYNEELYKKFILDEQ